MEASREARSAQAVQQSVDMLALKRSQEQLQALVDQCDEQTAEAKLKHQEKRRRQRAAEFERRLFNAEVMKELDNLRMGLDEVKKDRDMLKTEVAQLQEKVAMLEMGGVKGGEHAGSR